MPTLTPLLVKIELNGDGSAKYPDFSTLASVVASGSDWSKYVDVQGDGWVYDNSSGHADDTPSGRGQFDSPRGQHWGVLLIPLAFANEAVTAFPATCSILTEADLETYWDEFAMRDQPDDTENALILENIASRKAINGRIRARDVAALDPDDPTPGVTRNIRKTWARFKAARNITVG